MNQRFEIFTVLIAKISRSIRKIKTEEMSEFDLKSPHVSCLYYLYKNEGALTSKELCEICDEDKGAVSRAIDYLEKKGYVVCNSKTEKRYRSPLLLSEGGRKVGKKVVEKIDYVLDNASTGLSEGDRKILYKSLFLISDNLQKICDNYKG